MRIRYVISSMVFWGREHPLSFETECELLKSLGFGIELWPTLKGQHECRYERRNWPRLEAATEGMLVAMRSRYDSPTIGQWAEQIECAKRLGANIVTDLQTMGVPDNSELNGAGFAAEIVRLAQEHEVTLCLETGRLATLLEVGKRFESIRYCLDTGGGRADDECSFRQCVDELGPKIAHVHLSDIYGPPRNSLPPRTRTSAGTFGFPGDGSAYQGLCRFWCGGGRPREDWDYLLAALNEYDNDVIGSIEVSPCMPSVMIRQASEFLFDRLEWPNRPERPGLAKDPVGGEPLGRAGVEQ